MALVGSKALLLLQPGSAISELWDSVTQADKDGDAKVEELRLMAGRIMNARNERIAKLWEKIGNEVERQSLLPPGVVLDKTHRLTVEYQALVIIPITGECECPKCAFFRGIGLTAVVSSGPCKEDD